MDKFIVKPNNPLRETEVKRAMIANNWSRERAEKHVDYINKNKDSFAAAWRAFCGFPSHRN